MKKFQFSLEKYLEMKVREDEKLKRFLSDINNEIAALNFKINEIEEKETKRRQHHSEICRTGATGVQLHEYSEYMSYLHDVYIELNIKLNKLIKKSDEYRQKLIVLNNEIKALNRMKDEQYKQFLKEIQDAENRQLDDFVSFQAYSSL